MGLYKFSPSAIDTYKSCARKWAWDKIGKVPRAQHPSAALGERCHKQLENYLVSGEHPRHMHETGLVDDMGAIVSPSLEFLPPPGTVEVEKAFNFESPRTGFIYSGRIDWRRPLDAADIQALALPYPSEGWAEIGDHKSTSNLAYAKTPEDLLTDPQGVIYAVDAMAHYQVPHVRLHWNYISTKRPYRVLPVIQHVHTQGVAEEFKRIEGIATEMAHHLDTVGPDDILSLPANTNTCRAYGGCPYRYKCDLSPAESLRGLWGNSPTITPKQEDTTMDRLAMMRARLAGNAPPATAPATSAPGSVTPAAPTQMTVAASPVVAALAPAAPPAPVVVQTAFGPAAVEPGNQVAPGQVVVAPGQINPPERSDPPTAEQLDAAQRAAKGEAEPASKRHRRTKAEMEAARAAEASGQAAITVAAPTAPAPAPGPMTVPERAPIAILFVDCLPVKGVPFLDSAPLIAEANKRVCEGWKTATGQEVGDYRYIDYKGGGMLAEAAVALVKAHPQGVMGLAINTGTPEGKLLLNPLSAIAGAVVKGVVA
jgi:hypothetical protein